MTSMRLEKYNESDEQLYTQLVFNEAVMKMNLGRVFTAEEAEMAFRMVTVQNASESRLGVYKVFICEAGEEEYIGMGALCLNEEYNAVEIEFMLLPQHWNRGYGTMLVKNLVDMAAASGTDTQVVAITDPSNVFSQKTLLKNGFTFVKQYVNMDGEPAMLYQKNA